MKASNCLLYFVFESVGLLLQQMNQSLARSCECDLWEARGERPRGSKQSIFFNLFLVFIVRAIHPVQY